MNRLTSLLAVGVLAAIAVPSSAALNAYIKVTGSKQGVFKGAGKSKSHWISTQSFSFAIVSPRDPQSGLSTGQRLHKPMIFTLEASDSNEFIRALAAHETLTSVTLEVIKPATPGKVEHVQTIQLTNAGVASARKIKGTNGNELEEFQLTYQKITETQVTGKVTSMDDWLS